MLTSHQAFIYVEKFFTPQDAVLDNILNFHGLAKEIIVDL
jgi:hypothetical protein